MMPPVTRHSRTLTQAMVNLGARTPLHFAAFEIEPMINENAAALFAALFAAFAGALAIGTAAGATRAGGLARRAGSSDIQRR